MLQPNCNGCAGTLQIGMSYGRMFAVVFMKKTVNCTIKGFKWNEKNKSNGEKSPERAALNQEK